MRNRRLLFALFLCLAMVFGSVAWATEIMPLWDSCAMCAPDLYISGNTANCKLDVYAENSSDKITANIYLQKRNSRGNYTTQQSWTNQTGTGKLRFSATGSASSGESYRIKCDVVVDGSGGTDNITVYAYGN
ncbi:MAG: hypothetical protein HFJ96_00060 [Peptococcaceae bacterium]|jgi:hypothetical protein|nr:hypothetical protein [Peptococcaceae bacterium]